MMRKTWHPVSTMPIKRLVEIKTATGLVRVATRLRDEIREPKGTLRTPNVHCRSSGGGDLYAIAWRAPRRAKP